jgi:hypothetical protein
MNPSASSEVAPGKACGTCMMCCKLPLIQELDKPTDRWCRHAVIGKGCGIYTDRPPVCRSFHCQWIRDAQLGPEWKPEKAKFILYPDQEKKEVFNVAVDPAYPDAWTKPPFFAAIKNWVQEGAELGRYVMVRIGSRWTAVLPDRILELGHVEGAFALERGRGPTGRTIELRVKPPSPQAPAAAPAPPDS